ncbi:DUF362 domain-containing protein [Patescibacteria group bacterium]|nr:DUF362 domain-containing protein [Patescibacteria group bacterium]MBU1705798.1 DUF362 domain-containing protein [Patescibacteria group bacterium]
MSYVSVIKGNDRRENVRQALEALPASVWDKLKIARTVLIKPNLVHHQNQLASTHVDAVRAVMDAVRARSQARIVVGDSSYHGTKPAFRNFGYENLPNEYENVRLFDLNDDETVPGYFMKREGSKGEMGFSKTVAEADFTVCLTPMKTHRDVGVSLTTKNWTIGTWVPEARIGLQGRYWPRWMYLHAEGPEAHNSTIAELLHQHRPDLAVLDAFLAMEGDGPTKGEPIKLDLALAGDDCVSVDRMACELMSIDPYDIGYLVMANQRGYGIMDKSRIELSGETDLSSLKKEFKKPETWSKHVLAWKK